jgi:hypothetical protein
MLHEFPSNSSCYRPFLLQRGCSAGVVWSPFSQGKALGLSQCLGLAEKVAGTTDLAENSENHTYHYVSKLCASIIIDQNRMNLSNLDSAFEKTCIPIPIPYLQTSCLKAGFVKFGTVSINIDQAADFWYLYIIYIYIHIVALLLSYAYVHTGIT